MAMNPEVKAKWLAALRSGKYQQGRMALRTSWNEFCCLGVLCNLHAQAHPEIAASQTNPCLYLGELSVPHPLVREWAALDHRLGAVDIDINGVKLALTEHNDQGRTFAEIADAIEAQL